MNFQDKYGFYGNQTSKNSYLPDSIFQRVYDSNCLMDSLTPSYTGSPWMSEGLSREAGRHTESHPYLEKSVKECKQCKP